MQILYINCQIISILGYSVSIFPFKMPDIQLFYCLFLLTCWDLDNPITDKRLEGQCQVYPAPSNGIAPNDAISFICDSVPFKYLVHHDETQKVNTMVILSSPLRSQEYSNLKSINLLSLVLNECHDDETTSTSPSQMHLPTILNLFSKVKFLSINNSKLSRNLAIKLTYTEFWQSLNALEALYIDQSILELFDFSLAPTTKLRMLTIKSSQLQFIGHLSLCKQTGILEMLILASNKLKNVNWLLACKDPFANLHHLDLTANQLSVLPHNLGQLLPNLTVLHLATNYFKSLNMQILEPFFQIDQLMLAKQKTSSSILVYTVEVAELLNNVTSIAATSTQLPDYLVDSLINQFEYQCKNDFLKYDDGKLETTCRPEGELSSTFTVQGGSHQLYNQILKRNKFIEGSNFDSQAFQQLNDQIPPGSATDYPLEMLLGTFSKQRNAYTAAVQFFSDNSYGSSMETIRLRLFGTQMANYILAGEQLFTDEELQWMHFLVVDLLDEANRYNKNVLLVLWKYADIFKNPITFPNKSGNHNLKFLQILLNRISSHPALIGIEIVESFLEVYQLGQPQPDAYCQAPYLEELKPKMKMLTSLFNVVKAHSGSNLIGVSLNADCKNCLPFWLIPNCTYFLEVPVFNFITLITHFSDFEESEEVYNYKNWSKVNDTRFIFPTSTVFFYYLTNRGLVKRANGKFRANLISDIKTKAKVAGYFLNL